MGVDPGGGAPGGGRVGGRAARVVSRVTSALVAGRADQGGRGGAGQVKALCNSKVEIYKIRVNNG